MLHLPTRRQRRPRRRLPLRGVPLPAASRQYYPSYRHPIDVAEIPKRPPRQPGRALSFLKIDPDWLSLAIQARRLSPQDFDLLPVVRRSLMRLSILQRP